MTFQTAIGIFQQAQEVALQANDEANEGIAAGLIELTKAIQREFQDMERQIKAVETRVRRLD